MLVFGFSFIPEEARFDDDEVDSSVVNLITDTGLLVWGPARAPQHQRSPLATGEALQSAAEAITGDLTSTDTPQGVRTAVVRMPEMSAGQKAAAATVARQFADAAFRGDALSTDPGGFIEALQLTNPRIREEHNNMYLPRELGGRRDVDVVRGLGSAHRPILLEGPSGSGKTTLCREVFGEALLTVQCSRATTLGDIVGVNQPSGDADQPFTWVDGPLIVAMTEGRPLLLDDVGSLHHGVQAALHSVCDDRRSIDVIDRPADSHIKAKDGFTLVATLNPGEGYGMSTPMRNRMAAILTVPSHLSVARTLRVPALFVDVAERLERRAQVDSTNGMSSWVPSMRELLDARNLSDIFDERFAALALVSKCPDGTDREAVLAEFRRHLGESFAGAGVLVSGGHYDAVPATW